MTRSLRGAAAALVTLSLVFSGVAVASPSAARPQSDDSDFALLLDISDYYYGGSTADAVDLAKTICKKLKAPKTKAGKRRAANGVEQALSLAGWSAGKIGYFVGVATQTYCPAMYNVYVFR